MRDRHSALPVHRHSVHGVLRRNSPEGAVLDGEEGHAAFFLLLLYQSLDDNKLFVSGSIGLLVVWSMACAIRERRTPN